MNALSYELTLTAPALFLRSGHDRNTVDTWRRIPGGALAGALAGRWLRQNPRAQPTLDPDFRRLFLDGAVCYLHGYPVDADGARLLPAPLSWHGRKSDPDGAAAGRVWDLAAGPAEDAEDLRPVDLGFVSIGEEGRRVRHRAPQTRVHLHHTRARDKGRPDQGQSVKSIFHYQALAAGERFAAVILAERADDLGILQALLREGDLWLGRSRAAEYGGCARARVTSRGAGYSEVTFTDERPGEPLVVTLLSEYVGAAGAAVSGPALLRGLCAELAAALAVGPLPEPDPARSYVRYEPIGGFIGSWRMPRPQSLAVKAGSVLVFPGVEVPAGVLSLGERRAEGYGRVALGWHGHKLDLEREGASAGVVSAPRIPAVARPLLGAMAREWLRQRLPARLLQVERSAGAWPSPSVLAALRTDPAGALSRADSQKPLLRCRLRLPAGADKAYLNLRQLVEALDQEDFVLGLLGGDRRDAAPPLLRELDPAEWRGAARALCGVVRDALLADLRRRAQGELESALGAARRGS